MITLGLNQGVAVPSRFESNRHTLPNAPYIQNNSNSLTTHADQTYDFTAG